MRRILFLAIAMLPFLASAQLTARSLKATNGQLVGYYQYLPPDYGAQNHPLIISLHGIGERGNGTTELYKVLNVGIPRYINKKLHTLQFTFNNKKESFIVLAPQLSPSYGGWQNFYIDEMINYAVKYLKVDPNRIILTGLSLGGGGTWSYPSSSTVNAAKLAAIAPICGTCGMSYPSNIANNNLAVWAFHSTDDNRVSYSCSQTAVDKINAANPKIRAMLQTYTTGQHIIWDKAWDFNYTFQNPNIWEWFLGQNKALAPNKLPVANAGTNLSTTTAIASVTLKGSGSDADGTIVRYIWKKVSGPGYGTITSPLSASTTVTGLTYAGTYVYELTVVDSRASWGTSRVTVNVGASASVPNQAPVANAGPDQTITLPTNSGTLNAGYSSDADGKIVSYSWAKVAGPTTGGTIASPTSISTTISGLVEGIYTFRLTVTDDKGVSDTDDVIVTVNSSTSLTNTAPVANAGNDQSITLPTNYVTVNAGWSTDNDGKIVSYSWSMISGTGGIIEDPSAISTKISSLQAGTYTFRLTVKDDKGAVDYDDMVVTVNNSTSTNQAPVANAGYDQSITLPTNYVTVNAGWSKDNDGKIVSYYWTKVSGSGGIIENPSGVSTKISSLQAGTYTFRMTVKDDKGAVDYDDMVVIVNSSTSTNTAPVANAGYDQTLTLPTNYTTVNSGWSKDSDGKIVSYYWTKVSGSGGVIETPSGVSTKISSLTEGTYVFRITVKDDKGASDYDDLIITVKGSTSSTNLSGTNTAPVAVAGSDEVVTGSSVIVDGSQSYDDKGITDRTWVQLSGPNEAFIYSPKTESTYIDKLIPGTYYFRIRVWDAEGAYDKDDVMVTVNSSTLQANLSSTSLSDQTLTVSDAIGISPNPATSYINVEVSSPETGLTYINIYNLNGSLVKRVSLTKSSSSFTQHVDISSLLAGTYTAEVVINNSKTLTSRFIKQ